MRTLRQLNAYFKANKINKSNYDYDGFIFHLGGTETRYNDWGYNRISYEGGYLMQLECNQAHYCCGITEFGLYQGSSQYPEHWKAILEYAILKEKPEYLRTETITDGTCSALEEALPAVGFKLLHTINSKHAARHRQKYKIKI